MRAFRIERPGVAGLVDIAAPTPRPDEVLVRVRAATICHSDQQILRGQRKEKIVFPLIPGHELAGTVEALGPGVRGIAVGDPVACEGLNPCGRCPRCFENAPQTAGLRAG
jgi:D-arabinose 1-dehydrogenase-like Zn-dependent alcohol dehydrogenase